MKRIFVLIISLILALALVGCGGDEGQAAKTTAITDSLGRQVEVQLPLKKVVVANAYNTELINAVGAIESVVGVDFHIYRDQEGYKNRFKENQIIGKDQRELNYEKIIELAPDALILTSNGSWEEAERKLGEFGIKVITVDAYYTSDFFKNVKLIGQLFGREQQAEELSSYFQSKLDYISKQLAGVPKKTLYFEYRREGNTTVPGDYFFNMVEYSGAKNIFADAKNVSVDSESIVLRNPEYIVKVSDSNVGSSYLPPTQEAFAQRRAAICTRPGWDTITAVKENNILLLSHFVHGGASKLVGTMYIAKFLYPEQLPELHPEEVFQTWLTKYQHLDYIAGHTSPAFAVQE